jgi:hypothetical protein
MYMSLANAVDEAGLTGKVKLLFVSFGDYRTSTGSFSQIKGGNGWLGDAVKAQPGLKQRVDGLVDHPYGRPHENKGNENDWGPGALDVQHAEAVSLGFKNTDYYLTEFGIEWTPGEEGSINASTQALQAALIKEDYEEFLALPYVRGIWYYQAHDDSTGTWGLIEPQLNGRSPFVAREALTVIDEFAKAEN